MSYLKFYAGKSDERCGRSPAGMNATGESDLKNYYDYVDTLRESKLRPALEQLLPVIAMSAWGSVPENLDISFPPLWTPTASETAQIAERKALAIRDIFQAGLIQADTALRELKGLSEETGMFGNITDEEIAGAQGKTYQDVTAMHDMFAGLGYDREEDTGPFEVSAQDAADRKYIQLPNGKMNGSLPGSEKNDWTGGSGAGKIGKTKYAPSPQRSKRGIQLKPKTYARLTGTLNTRFPGLKAGEIRRIRDSNNEYIVKADGFGGFETISKRRI